MGSPVLQFQSISKAPDETAAFGTSLFGWTVDSLITARGKPARNSRLIPPRKAREKCGPTVGQSLFRFEFANSRKA